MTQNYYAAVGIDGTIHWGGCKYPLGIYPTLEGAKRNLRTCPGATLTRWNYNTSGQYDKVEYPNPAFPYRVAKVIPTFVNVPISVTVEVPSDKVDYIKQIARLSNEV